MLPFRYDLTGKKFNHLTVICHAERPAHIKSSCSRWLCRCDCGKEKVVRGTYLRNGLIKACGCLNGVRPNKENEPIHVGKLSYTYFSRLKSAAKKRGKVFELTMNQMWDLFESQGGQCKISGLKIDLDPRLGRRGHQSQTASLDRIDSSKGYVEGNVQWVHKRINSMKNDMPQSEFIALVDAISRYQAAFATV